jgi:Right handed beta helix region
MAGHRDFVIRGAQGGVRNADTLVIGPGVRIADHAATGLPELQGGDAGEAVLVPSGGDDTAMIQAALWEEPRVRLGPGTFQLSGRLYIGNGATLSGSGAAHTILNAPHADHLLVFGDGCENACIEHLTVRGPGKGASTGAGIISYRGSGGPAIARRLRVRDVRVEDAGGHGIHLADVAEAEIADVDIDGAGTTGVRLERAETTAVRNLRVNDVGQYGLELATAYYTDVSVVRVDLAGNYGVYVDSGRAVRLGAMTVNGCRRAVVLSGCKGVSVDDVLAAGELTGVRVDSSDAVTLTSIRALGFDEAGLLVRGGGHLTATGFLADQGYRTSLVNVPHVKVTADPPYTTGAVNVTLIGFQKVNAAAGAPTFEADVAGAGGRVVFIQHNIDTTRVNGTANFAAL